MRILHRAVQQDGSYQKDDQYKHQVHDIWWHVAEYFQGVEFVAGFDLQSEVPYSVRDSLDE